MGLANPAGILIGVVGGMLSFTGIVMGADVVMPPVLRFAGRLSGRSAPARLAAENAVRHPQRSSRATIGLVIGVTLVTMFAVAMAGFEASIRVAQAEQPEAYEGIDATLAATTAVFTILVGFSGLIAAVGLVNNLSLSVLQRRRELGLLRALGFTVPQVRRMVLAESAQLTFSAIVLGLVLGRVLRLGGCAVAARGGLAQHRDSRDAVARDRSRRRRRRGVDGGRLVGTGSGGRAGVSRRGARGRVTPGEK